MIIIILKNLERLKIIVSLKHMPSLNREFFVVLFSHGSLWAAVCPRLPRFPQRWSQIALTRALVFISRWLLRAHDWCGSSPNSGTHCFKTTYLSYECFIQETKYELAFWKPPPRALQSGRLMHANNGDFRVCGRRRDGNNKQQKADTKHIESSAGLRPCNPSVLFLCCAPRPVALSSCFAGIEIRWKASRDKQYCPKSPKLSQHSNRSIKFTQKGGE